MATSGYFLLATDGDFLMAIHRPCTQPQREGPSLEWCDVDSKPRQQPSPTGVRIAGDDYQWLAAWSECVDALADDQKDRRNSHRRRGRPGHRPADPRSLRRLRGRAVHAVGRAHCHRLRGRLQHRLSAAQQVDQGGLGQPK
jgi:hypothetical protein